MNQSDNLLDSKVKEYNQTASSPKEKRRRIVRYYKRQPNKALKKKWVNIDKTERKV